MRTVLRVAGICAGAFVCSGAAPVQVADIQIPQTALALKAEQYVRGAEPDFLFNHSVRTYLFGALRLKARGIPFDAETAYVAALFHDIGLVPAMASPDGSFEIDGANRAEAFATVNGGSPAQARTVWNAVVFHDMGGQYERHQGAEALLLGAGAGSDVDGVDPKAIPPATVDAVLRAYPRLQFKKRFTAAAINHCRRKPTSQIGWLEVLCVKVVPHADRGSVEEEIASAPFAE
jgi:HD domain-containing protein